MKSSLSFVDANEGSNVEKNGETAEGRSSVKCREKPFAERE